MIHFGCLTEDGRFDGEMFEEQTSDDQVKAIEIKLSQGAKPGHGGILPGAKVTEEFAEARRVPVGVDCISPPGHSEFSTPIGLLEFVDRLHALSGGKPIGFKLCVGRFDEVFAICKAMLESGIAPDFITADGGEQVEPRETRSCPDIGDGQCSTTALPRIPYDGLRRHRHPRALPRVRDLVLSQEGSRLWAAK